jgi:hypothetical protein
VVNNKQREESSAQKARSDSRGQATSAASGGSGTGGAKAMSATTAMLSPPLAAATVSSEGTSSIGPKKLFCQKCTSTNHNT